MNRKAQIESESMDILVVSFSTSLKVGPNTWENSIEEVVKFLDGLQPTGKDTAIYDSWIELHERVIMYYLSPHSVDSQNG